MSESKLASIPDGVAETLIQVLNSHQMNLKKDPGLAEMGAPDAEETEEALEWVKEHY